MEFIYKTIKAFYQTKGNGDELVVFLHGWGAGSELFISFASYLFDEKYTFLFIDFPPFGQSEEPKNVWTMSDYQTLTAEIIQELQNIKMFHSINIIGHSFGGRVAILLASNNLPINKIVLIASAGLKAKRGLQYWLKICKYKILKKFSPQKASKLGSEDYKKLSPVMKGTFTNIVNADLTSNCKKIDCQSLIIWGENDHETPLYMAKKLKKLIKNSQLVIIKNANHFVYLQQPEIISKYITLFLNS